MPRIPLYSGQIASAVMPQSFVPRDSSFASAYLRDGGGGGGRGSAAGGLEGMLIRKVFGLPDPADPDAERANYYKAQTAETQDKIDRAQRGDRAESGYSSDLEGIGKKPVYPEGWQNFGENVDPLPGQEGEPQTPAERRAAAAAALVRGIGGGADPKRANAIMAAFMLQGGDDNEIVRTNSALEQKYLGDNQSPSLDAQRTKIEDEQRSAMDKADLEDRTKRYGFDLQHDDRVRGQDLQHDDRVRGQNLTDARVRDRPAGGRAPAAPKPIYDTITETIPADKGSAGSPAKHKFLGIFGEEKPAVAGRPARGAKRITRKVLHEGGKADPLGIR